jgi:hypothetical protein
MHKVWRAQAGYDRGFRTRTLEEKGMQFASIVVAAGVGIGCCSPAGAGDAWVEAQSLRELPAGIQALLGVGLGENGGIADRGDRFNAGDVVGNGLPQRRFALGAVNGDTAVVAVEHGGRGYSVATVEFKQMGATWEPVRCTVGSEPPRRSTELLDSIKARQAAAMGACRLPGFHPDPATATTAILSPNFQPPPQMNSQPSAQPRLRPRPGG